MSDLISRELAIELLNNTIAVTKKEERRRNYCVELIKTMPSAEPEPKKGEWIKMIENGWYGRCSNCGTVTDYNFPFCPYCGYQMAGTAEADIREEK